MKKWDLTKPDIILKIHRNMYQDVWKWAGTYRKIETNIGVMPTLIPQKLAELCKNLEYWIQSDTFKNKIELAIIFHHRLVKIHPFPNGNGRLSRICAEILAKQFRQPPIKWATELGTSSADRQRYIDALQKADANDFSGLEVYWKNNV